MENVRAPVPDVGTVPYLPVSAAARDETDAVRDDGCAFASINSLRRMLHARLRRCI
jgi:hypothetical protein